MNTSAGRIVCHILFLSAVLARSAISAPAHEVMYSWELGPENPNELIQASDGNFYGTSQNGGVFKLGTVFKMTPSGEVTTLVNFSGNGATNKGANPRAGLVEGSDGFLYGTTYYGGAGNFGTVFRMSKAGALATLVEFTNSAGSFLGSYPNAALIQGSDGFFYGTTCEGGLYGSGTVFKLSAGGIFTSYPLTGVGYRPLTSLVEGSDGFLYGTTSRGGSGGDYGTIYKMSPSGTFNSLVAFTFYDGKNPNGLLLSSDGNFYGTTLDGGEGKGTVFKMSSDGTLTTLLEYSFNGTGPAFPRAALIEGSDGKIYGSTSDDSSRLGSIFRIESDNTISTLLEFTGVDGANKGSKPRDRLVQGSDGFIYGTTPSGGATNRGTVFKMATSGELTTVVDFSGTISGEGPQASLVLGENGKFYGTTARGGVVSNEGASGYGTQFSISPFGTMRKLSDYTSFTDGQSPISALTVGIDGNFYGTTPFGGGFYTSNYPYIGSTFNPASGIFYKVTPAGGRSTLLLFGQAKFHIEGDPSGETPKAALVRDAAGDFYGTTSAGGANGFGKIFRTTTTGVLTTLVDFTGTDGLAKGSDPQGELLLASGGNYYGTTNTGGATDLGTVFRMTPTGALTTLVEFTGDGAANKGANPQAALIQGTNGKFYGTTTAGGAGNHGTIFRMTSAGVLTTLVQFTGNGATNKGASPKGALLEGADGNFYGTTLKGGTYDAGTVFRMTPFGTLTTLVHFRPHPSARGAHPHAGLVKGTDNNFYGTTEQGGEGGGGTVFRLRFGPTPETKAATGVASTTATLAGRVNPRGLATTVSFQIGTKRTFGGTSPMFVTTLPAGTTFKSLSLPVSGLAPNTKYYFRIVAENPDNSVPQTGKTYSFTTLP